MEHGGGDIEARGRTGLPLGNAAARKQREETS